MGLALSCDDQLAFQHEGIFVELGPLAGLDPAGGLVIRAMLTASVPELTRPINSSIFLGLLPAASMTVGAVIRRAMGPSIPQALLFKATK